MKPASANKPAGPTLRRRRIFGGINPAPHKAVSLRSRIMPMPLPPALVLPLRQYKGTDAVPVVNVGERIRKYQLVARGDEDDGVNLHAPTSGTVTAIAEGPITGPPGTRGNCIHLQCDGEDTALELAAIAAHHDLSGPDLIDRIARAGIVGMGGAGFPTAQKLRLAAAHGADLLIINAAECEPYISTDEALLRERARQVVVGADILRRAAGAVRCVIAIESDKVDAIAALRSALVDSDVELLPLRNAYPTGSERQIVQAVTGQEVPGGAYPLDLGIVVHNAGTAFAAYQAVIEGKPCVSRITTLTGAALLTPKNFDALIGTPVSFLFQLCGIDKTQHRTTVLGGSLMGIELPDTELPIEKTSNCLIAATATEFPAPEPELACIRCGYCAEVCPARLLPQALYSFARVHNHDQLQAYGLDDCIECGACAFVCPSHIPLVQYYVAAKQELQEAATQRAQSEHWKSRFQLHQYRIKKEKDTPVTRRPSTPTTATAASDNTDVSHFSRTRARQEIADAVARAKARKAAQQQAPARPDTTNDTEDRN